MKAKLNTKFPMQNAKAASSTSSNSYAPSVPISLYREIVTELQVTKTTMESLKAQNQQLSQQNQQLRIEIERVVQSALRLRQAADAQQQAFSVSESDVAQSNLELHVEQPPVPPVPASPSRPAAKAEKPAPEKLFTEQSAQPRRTAQLERSSETSSWWLVLVVCLIVVTAFGVGFVIVRPLLPSR
jgi:cobalamin biosynthesis Mg chelatase CobN